jgi:hypothetical protein
MSEILKGRAVLSYDVLARIAGGLSISRGWMGLAYDERTWSSGSSPAGQQDLIRLRQAGGFVGRQEELAQFLENRNPAAFRFPDGMSDVERAHAHREARLGLGGVRPLRR